MRPDTLVVPRRPPGRPRWLRALAGLVAACGVALTGCSGLAPHPRSESADPDVRLEALLEQLAIASPALALRGEEAVIVDSGHLRNEVERLTLEFPAHRPSLLAAAQLAFEAGETEKAAAYAVRARSLGDPDGAATMLRVRIALEQGAVGAAERLLEDQLLYTPDRPGLLELLAAVHFAREDFDACLRALGEAEALGADPERIGYLRGLVSRRTAEGR